MQKNKYEIDMCQGTIMDKLITFALPLMLSGILQLMFNAVDIIVVGRFSGSQALAAVGSTTALINVFTNLFIGISLGSNVLAARLYAAGKEKRNVGSGTHIHCHGTGQWCGHGDHRCAFCRAGTGGHGDPGGCHRTVGALHAHLFSGHAFFYALQLRRRYTESSRRHS